MSARTLDVLVSGDPAEIATVLLRLVRRLEAGSFETGALDLEDYRPVRGCGPMRALVGRATWHEDCTFSDLVAKREAS